MSPIAQPQVVLARQSPPHCTARAATAYPLDLRLVEGALHRIGSARDCMEEGADREKSLYLQSAVLLVGQLRSSLDLAAGCPVAVNLDELCHYVSRQLMSADRWDDMGTLDEVSDLLREVRSAWTTLSYV